MTTQAPVLHGDLPLSAGAPVEVWCSFDHSWHHGFVVCQIERSHDRTSVVLARSDGTVLPRSVEMARVRPDY